MSEQKKSGQFDTTCSDRGIYKGCGQTITMKKEPDGWHAYNKDGTLHKHESRQSRQETSTSPQQTLPLQSQQKEEKAENAVVSPELDEIHKEAVFACQKYLAGMFDNEKDDYKRIMWVMHYENLVAQLRTKK